MVLAENVSGGGSAGDGGHFQIILNDLANTGYSLVSNMYKFENMGYLRLAIELSLLVS